MNSPDPFDLGMIGVQDIKDAIGNLVNRIQFAEGRKDLWIEMIDDAKAAMIDACARNASIFEVRRRKE